MRQRVETLAGKVEQPYSLIKLEHKVRETDLDSRNPLCLLIGGELPPFSPNGNSLTLSEDCASKEGRGR